MWGGNCSPGVLVWCFFHARSSHGKNCGRLCSSRTRGVPSGTVRIRRPRGSRVRRVRRARAEGRTLAASLVPPAKGRWTYSGRGGKAPRALWERCTVFFSGMGQGCHRQQALVKGQSCIFPSRTGSGPPGRIFPQCAGTPFADFFQARAKEEFSNRCKASKEHV